MPDAPPILGRASSAFGKQGQIIILDLKVPDRLPMWLIRLLLPLVAPFAVTEGLVRQKPWEMIKRAMTELFHRVDFTEMYGGFAYLISGRFNGE